MGKFLVLLTVFSAIFAGGAIYYLQVYAYYEPVTLSDSPAGPGETRITLTPLAGGQATPVAVSDFQGIDAASSPLRFRACFKLDQDPARVRETYAAYPGAVPLIGPKWFDCFDAKKIGADLESGKAVALMGQENITYGIDRVVALYDDGRAYAWHQLNHCGEVVYDGQPAPEGCPPPPERTQ